MGKQDFEVHFERMGLQALPAGVSCDATFAAGSHDDTFASGPRSEVTAVEPSLGGTLPRQVLATPDAAREQTGADEVEFHFPQGVTPEAGAKLRKVNVGGQSLIARRRYEWQRPILTPWRTNTIACCISVKRSHSVGMRTRPSMITTATVSLSRVAGWCSPEADQLEWHEAGLIDDGALRPSRRAAASRHPAAAADVRLADACMTSRTLLGQDVRHD